MKKSVIQAVLFPYNFSTNQARYWLKKHNLKPIKKVHKTENYLRYRITEPRENKKYITKHLNNNIVLIIEY